MRPLARSAGKGQPAQEYREHLAGIKERLDLYLAQIEPYIDEERMELYRNILERARLFHDLGKISSANQRVLAETMEEPRESLPLDHRDAGVKGILEGRRFCPEALLIRAHHGKGLERPLIQKAAACPFRNLDDAETIKDTDKNLDKYLTQHTMEAGEVPPPAPMKDPLFAMEYRLLLSMLCTADGHDAGRVPLEDDSETAPDWLVWKERVRNRAEEDALCADRAEWDFFDQLKEGLHQALEKEELNGMRRLFVVTGKAPKAAVRKSVGKILGIKAGEIGDSQWAKSVVVTSEKQFFNRLAARKGSALYDLRYLPGSCVLFLDLLGEIGASLDIWLLVMHWTRQLAEAWGCCFWLCTAKGVVYFDKGEIEEDVFREVSDEPLARKLKAERRRNDKSSIKRLRKAEEKCDFEKISACFK